VSNHPTAFGAFIAEQIATRFDTATALARAVGLQLPAFLRGVEKGTFSVANLLKLAAATDTPPSVVLRLAGKHDVADLIEELYGKQTSLLTAEERRLLARWRSLSPRARQSIETIMADLPPTTEGARSSKRTRSA
jgi:hypothetical protein